MFPTLHLNWVSHSHKINYYPTQNEEFKTHLNTQIKAIPMQLAEDMENQVFWPELGWGFQKPDSDSDVKHLSNGCKSTQKLEDWIFMLYYHENRIWTHKKCLKILYIAFSLIVIFICRTNYAKTKRANHTVEWNQSKLQCFVVCLINGLLLTFRLHTCSDQFSRRNF